MAVSLLIKYDFDIVLLASDDMIPRVKGYDTIIRNKNLIKKTVPPAIKKGRIKFNKKSN